MGVYRFKLERYDHRFPAHADQMWLHAMITVAGIVSAKASYGLSLYMVPIVIGIVRNRPMKRIIIWCGFLGWTGIGWMIGFWEAIGDDTGLTLEPLTALQQAANAAHYAFEHREWSNDGGLDPIEPGRLNKPRIRRCVQEAIQTADYVVTLRETGEQFIVHRDQDFVISCFVAEDGNEYLFATRWLANRQETSGRSVWLRADATTLFERSAPPSKSKLTAIGLRKAYPRVPTPELELSDAG